MDFAWNLLLLCIILPTFTLQFIEIYEEQNFSFSNSSTSNSRQNVYTTEVPTSSPHSFCDHLKGLSPGQIKHCHMYEDHMEFVADGVELSLKECQRQFKYHRWNCTLNSQHRTFLGPISKLVNCFSRSKEAAYLQAMTSAGVMYSIARSCRDGHLTRCGCSTLARPTDLYKDWVWRGCGDNLEYAYKFTRNLMDIKEQEKIHHTKKDAKEYVHSLMTLHNNEAGRRTILKMTRVTCKCHGVSGSCSLITCWHQMPMFVEIGNYVKRKYNSAIKVKKNRKGKLQVKNSGRKPTVTDLVYIHQSPNYCVKNDTIGILGTEDRECNLKMQELGNCNELCCNRGYKVKQIFIKEKCNCKFHWCCHIQCDVCTSMKELYICK